MPTHIEFLFFSRLLVFPCVNAGRCQSMPRTDGRRSRRSSFHVGRLDCRRVNGQGRACTPRTKITLFAYLFLSIFLWVQFRFFSFNLKRFYPEMYDVMFHSVDVEPSSFLNWYFLFALLWSAVINEINIRYENSRHADDCIIILLAPSAFLVILPGHPGFHWMRKPGGFFFSNFSGYLL